MRHRLRPLWIVLALVILLEAWLWDHLEPAVARVVRLIPWGRLKGWIKRAIESLPPWAALGVFIVPFIVLLPLKLLEIYLIAMRNWLGVGLVLLAAKLLGLGVTALVFDATRDKLMRKVWFDRMYDWFMGARDWAHEMAEPVRARPRELTWLLKPQRAGHFPRRLMRMRANAHRQAM